MQSVSIVLVQIRTPSDPMAGHERACIARRFDGLPVQLSAYNVFGELPHPGWIQGADVLLIGGSGAFSVHDSRSRPWVTGLRHLLDRALAKDMVGMGLCFGHQMLAYHLGGEVVTEADAAEVGTVEVFLTEAGERDAVFGALGSGPVRVQTGHEDSVVKPPDELELLARSAGAASQACRVSGGRFYSTQFHPDLTGEEAQERYDALKKDEEGVPGETPCRPLFVAGADDSTILLRRLVESAFPLQSNS